MKTMNSRRLNLPFSEKIFPPSDRHAAYVVGGAVRDALLGGAPLDYDIVVSGDCRAFARETAANISGRLVELGKPGQSIYRIVTDAYILDITPLAEGTLERDLAKRDFTIDALAYDFRSTRMIDLFSGLDDLATGKIRMLAPSVFQNDPVRLIRAYRLANTLGFEIEPKTIAQIRQDAPLIRSSAGERIREELVRILDASESQTTLKHMSESGLLAAILPELTALRKCRADRFHALDAYTHSLRAYARLEHMLNHIASYLPLEAVRERKFPETGSKSMLKFAILVHDIGKARTESTDAQGRIHFYGHAQKSAQMFSDIRKRLKLSNHDAEYIHFIVKNHLRPLHLYSALRGKPVPEGIPGKTTVRFFMKCGPRTPDLLLHSLADMAAKSEKEDRRERDFTRFVTQVLQAYFEHHKPLLSEPPLLTGHDLIRTFGLEPSPLFKMILTRVETERLSGRLRTKPDAEHWVEAFLEKRKPKKT